MPVYFIGKDENGCLPIKVGIAKDIGRKSALQTGNPLGLKLLGWITSADGFKTERDPHQRLAPRGRGEWFHIEPTEVLPLLMEVGQRGSSPRTPMPLRSPATIYLWGVHAPLRASLLRPADQPEFVRSVLDGSNSDPRDRLLTVLMIVWRFRNDLFHGEKWSYHIQDQLSNFTHVNTVLMRLIDSHGQLAA